MYAKKVSNRRETPKDYNKNCYRLLYYAWKTFSHINIPIVFPTYTSKNNTRYNERSLRVGFFLKDSGMW